jgi:CubicO group peptidase (beta-lactamase class C family)
LLLGYENRELRRRVTEQTVFQIGSITKSVTCLSLLQLQERGRLSLHDRVLTHLPEIDGDARRWARTVTVEKLMTHTSGLPPLPNYSYQIARSRRYDPTFNPRSPRNSGIDPDHAPLDSFEDFLGELSTLRRKALYPPGRVFSYSNDGYALLGAIVERASGLRYENYVEENVLRPIGARESTFDTGVMLRDGHVAVPYGTLEGKRPSVVPIPVWWEQSVFRAAGALRMSVRDLLGLAQVFRDGGRAAGARIVTKASLREMVRPRMNLEPGFWYGYGMCIYLDYHGHLLWGNSGGLQGCCAEILVVPREGLAGAALSNFREGCAPAILRGAVNEALGLPLDEISSLPPAPARAPQPIRADYAGVYASGEGARLRVKVCHGHLRVELPRGDGTSFSAFPYDSDQFWFGPPKVASLITFHRPSGRRPDRVFFGARWLRRRSGGELKISLRR